MIGLNRRLHQNAGQGARDFPAVLKIGAKVHGLDLNEETPSRHIPKMNKKYHPIIHSHHPVDAENIRPAPRRFYGWLPQCHPQSGLL